MAPIVVFITALVLCVLSVQLPASSYDEALKQETVEVTDSNRRVAHDVSRAIERGEMRYRANLALGFILRLGVWKLRQNGHTGPADKIWNEWNGRWDGYIMGLAYDLGDHAPLSLWLAQTYQVFYLLLGETICKALHLDDLNILNFGLPVVIRPCDSEWDKAEYQKHFVPVAGVITYWSAWGACVGASLGTGIVYVCGTAGMGAEWLMIRFLAPKLSHKVYELACE